MEVVLYNLAHFSHESHFPYNVPVLLINIRYKKRSCSLDNYSFEEHPFTHIKTEKKLLTAFLYDQVLAATTTRLRWPTIGVLK